MNGRALMVVVSLSLVFGIVIVVGLEGPEVLVPRPIPAAHSGGAMTAIPLGVSATLSPSLAPTHTPTGVFSPRSTSTAELRVTPSSPPTPTPTIVPPTPTGEAASPTMAMAAPASCARIDFEVIRASTKTADAGLGPTELVWRVRNRATDAECMWGGGGQETDSLYAREITGQVTETQKAKLTWVGGNEYELALAPPPGLQYALVWRLVVPATGEVGGPELVAPREAVALTPTPTPTIIPTPTPTPTATPTPCPTEVYECRCKDKCQTDSITGRTVCRRVCDHCTRSACP